MTDRETVATWLAAYRTAWATNAESDIRALFTDDATYRTAPFDPPWVGVDAIVAGWIAGADAPDDHVFRAEVAGIDGDRAFVTGETDYTDERPDYANLWVIDLAPDGRARAFTEWYMTRPAGSP